MSEALLEPEAPPARPEAHQLVGQIRKIVLRNSWRWKLLTMLEGLGLIVAALLSYLWLAFWLDNVLHLSFAARVAAAVGLLAGICFLMANLVRRWRRMQFTEDHVALAIERRTPGGVQNRLINAIQIARTPRADQADLSIAVIEENVEQIKKLELEQAAALRPALAQLAVAAVLLILGFVFYFLHPERFANAATRILMPFANVDPIYRTSLTVEPGDVEALGDVTLQIAIHGEPVDQLTLLQDIKGKRRSEFIRVPKGAKTVTHILKAEQQTTLYAVRGGDFTTRFYQITVPIPSHLSLLKAVYHYPAYTGLADKPKETASGDIEALRGSKVDLEFVLDQPCEQTVLIVEKPAKAGAATPTPVTERITLKAADSTHFKGQLALDDQSAYQIETKQTGRPAHTSRSYTIRIVADQEPRVELTGLDGKSEVAVDATLPLQVKAMDDLGLQEAGLFYRRAALDGVAGEDWKAVQVWKAERKPKLEQTSDLMLLSMGAAEGEKLDVVARATDFDPAKSGRWTDSVVYHLKVGGDAAVLQLLYEQILQTEADLKQLVPAQQKVMRQAADWVRKIDAGSEDAKNVKALHEAVADQAKQQAKVREQTSRIARAMVEQAGNLRLSVGMLADTEMEWAARIYESVPTRDQVQAKRTALADVQLTEQRTIASLQQILDQYVLFRQDWELANMTGFVKMLGDRQAVLRDTSRANVGKPQDKMSELTQASASKRQEKMVALTKLSETAFHGLAERSEASIPILATAFKTAAQALAANDLVSAMQQAAAGIKKAEWTPAATQQALAADRFMAIHAALRKAQAEAAKEALAALEEKAKSDLEAQKELKKLKPGTDKANVNMPEKLTIKDIVHMQEVAAAKRGSGDNQEGKVDPYSMPDSKIASLQRPDMGVKQDVNNLKLGPSAGGATPSIPAMAEREGNPITPHIQEEFEDLVGDLIAKADEIQENYETHNMNVANQTNETGEVHSGGHDMNSTAAAAATGNKPPPSSDIGGASRSGRSDARAHGLVVGDEAQNLKGRDKPQEGQEQVPDQEGLLHEKESSDPPHDASTGIGGKRVDSKQTKFSTADSGKWTDDMKDRMVKPQDKNYIVERQDGRFDPKMAAMLRDLTSEHEQIIERAKVIRKELKNLYLPTDRLDEIIAELGVQLDRLKEKPGPDLFRLEHQSLDKLRGVMRVFYQAHAGFQPSVPRNQTIHGYVLDEANRPAQPGYELAVKRYYEKLSQGEKR